MEVKEISHFTHPGHVLSLDQSSTEFTCDLCKIPSKNQPRYKCTTCPDFNLDPVCAICHEDTTSFMHPDHTMVLFLSPELTTTNILCSVCNQDIKGGHYSCCDFHAHPVCTKFPEVVKAGASPTHEDHEMKGIISSVLTTCHVCRHDCTGLRYRCKEGCDVDFHPSCLAGFTDRDLMDDDGDGTVGNTRGSLGVLKTTIEVVMLGIDLWEIVKRLNEFNRKSMVDTTAVATSMSTPSASNSRRSSRPGRRRHMRTTK